MQRRGRSRHISPAAIARQASEERRRRAIEALQGRNQYPCSRPQSSPIPVPPIPRKPTPLLKLTPPTPTLPQPCTPPVASLDSTSIATPPIPVLSPPSTSRSLSPSPIRTPTDTEAAPSFRGDYYDSPPSPPRSIEDQLHVAYALDDIRLAKIILLKLKGINVTSDNDPVIDTVRDEDFDAYFVPAGGLVVDIDGKKPVPVDAEEGRRRERERCEERQRRERLKECERKWDEEKRRAGEEKLRATRKKEEEEEERKRAEGIMKQIELEAERMRSQRQRRPGLQRNHMAYGVNSLGTPPVASVSKHAYEPFQYDCMPPIKLGTPPKRPPKSKVDSSVRLSCTIPFKDVLNSMSGPLFPPEPTELCRSQDRNTHRDLFADGHDKRHSWPTSQPSRTYSSRPSRTPLQTELLTNLLKVVEWEEGERRRLKGKSTDTSPRKRQRTNSGSCAACSAASSPPSASTTSRSGSWLSFGGSSRSSASTTVTTPSSSPISSWLKAKPAISSPNTSLPVKAKALTHSCQPSDWMTPVAASESPLPIPVDSAPSRKQEGLSRRPSMVSATTPVEADVKSNNTILKRMSTWVDLAKGFPVAYIGGTILNVSLATNDKPLTRKERPSPMPRPKLRPKPLGCRARPKDVLIFTSASQELSIPPTHAPQYIPLTNPNPPTKSEIKARSLTFPPPHPLPRSPFRPLKPPSVLLWRVRPVGNPVTLRLQALHNSLCQKGLEWDIRMGRDGMLGCGRDRLVGVAWEGLGRSGLSWQVTAAC
jgi:hypothetical protein